MKGYKILKPFSLKEQEIAEQDAAQSLSKIKITKSLISLPDVLRFNGEIPYQNVVLGSHGIGVVSETDANLFGLEKGKRVYVESNKPCNNCYSCISGEPNKCFDLMIAGEDYDGFLADFIKAAPEDIYPLPDSVSDSEALFIGHISLATSIVDKLEIQKGDYVAVVGTNNYANILSQLLVYYQAVPIVCGFDEEGIKAVKDAGIYYVLGSEDNWQKEVSSITGGRMTKSVVYFSDSNIPVIKAFGVASYNAGVVFTGVSYKNSPITFSQAIKKQLNIYCKNETSGYTATSINLIANKAINLSYLNVANTKYDKVPEAFKKLSQELEETDKITETIVENV